MWLSLFTGLTKLFTGFSLRQWLPIFFILGLVLSFWYNIHGYKKEIVILNKDITKLNNTIDEMKKDRFQLELEKYNLELVTQSLKDEIEFCNSNVEAFRAMESNLTKTIQHLKDNPEIKIIKEIEERVVKDKKNPTCREYEKLSREISKIKYEDLKR